MKTTLSKISTFFEMIKWEHSIFALPFAYLGLFLAVKGWPELTTFVLVTLAMISFRTMGMALNRIIDREIDRRNPRTESRAIPSGKLKVGFVWGMVLISFLIFEYCAYQLNPLCFSLTPVPVLLAWLYPYAKRFTWLSHFLLGMILGIAPYGAWLASGAPWSWVPAFFMVGVVSWVAGFDVIYALQDVAFDQKAGLYSFPARFGVPAALALTRWLHVVTLISWSFAGWLAGLGLIYAIGILTAALFLVREHRLIKVFGIQKVHEAFFMMNAFVSVTVLIAVLFDLGLRSASL